MSGTNTGFFLRLTAAITVALFVTVLHAPFADAHVLQRVRRERRHIRERAISQRGAPYRYGGASPSGFDCSGLTRWTFLDHGASLPHSSMDQWRRGSRDAYDRIWKRKKLNKGDLVFFKTTDARVGHVGIYVGRGKFISATSSEGVRVRSVWDRYYWGRRWVGAVRAPALRR
jgi:cell wall-associated NlpC family hydrolase